MAKHADGPKSGRMGFGFQQAKAAGVPFVASRNPRAKRVYYVRSRLPPEPGKILPREVVETVICTREEAEKKARDLTKQYGVRFWVSTRL